MGYRRGTIHGNLVSQITFEDVPEIVSSLVKIAPLICFLIWKLPIPEHRQLLSAHLKAFLSSVDHPEHRPGCTKATTCKNCILEAQIKLAMILVRELYDVITMYSDEDAL